VLTDAQVDLNPHQIEAAPFSFRNPFSRGAILADEVGLGKTIEAGLLLAQHWAELPFAICATDCESERCLISRRRRKGFVFGSIAAVAKSITATLHRACSPALAGL
jgi:hypothetical protein